MNKVALSIALSMLLLCACAGNNITPPAEPTPEYQRIMMKNDKFMDGYYAGYLVKIAKNKVTINTEGELFEYKLTDTSKKHIAELGIVLNDAVMVAFEINQDGSRTATALEKVVN